MVIKDKNISFKASELLDHLIQSKLLCFGIDKPQNATLEPKLARSSSIPNAVSTSVKNNSLNLILFTPLFLYFCNIEPGAAHRYRFKINFIFLYWSSKTV